MFDSGNPKSMVVVEKVRILTKKTMKRANKSEDEFRKAVSIKVDPILWEAVQAMASQLDMTQARIVEYCVRSQIGKALTDHLSRNLSIQGADGVIAFLNQTSKPSESAKALLGENMEIAQESVEKLGDEMIAARVEEDMVRMKKRRNK